MKLIRRAIEMRRYSQSCRRRGLRVGFVPTMGALHEGHGSLLRRARAGCDRVVASIFVNPMQFGPDEDFARYPRPLSLDRAACVRAGADVLFLPSVAEMYPQGFRARVEVEVLSEVLDGKFRPGHFQGVATVVLKLFEIVLPHRAYFGEKDYQQLVIIRRMVLDLNLPVEIVPCPTVREEDGLAMSSRNTYLSPLERAWAPTLHRALASGAELARLRPKTPVSAMLRRVRREILRIPGARIDYVAAADSVTLEEPIQLRGNLRLLAAIRIGRTRLIDNVPILGEDRPPPVSHRKTRTAK